MAGDLSLVPRRIDGVLLESVEGDLLAFDGVTLSRLSGATALVMTAVDGGRSVGDIASDLASATGRHVDTLLPEIDAAVDLLVGNGLIELVTRPSPATYRVPAYVGYCYDDDRIVLLDLRSGMRHAMDVAGSKLWDLLVSLGSLTAAITELERAFPASHAVGDEAARFAVELVDHGLLLRSTPAD